MIMITKIRILITDNAYQKKYIIDLKKNTFTKNDVTKQIVPDKISDIIKMINTWNQEYKSNNVIDGEEFYIEVITDKNTTTLHGKGSYPSNYADFKTLLDEL